MRPPYLDLLTPDERAAAIRFGMLTKFAEQGFFVKQGVVEFNFNPLDAAAKTIFVLSFLTGVPAGILAHKIHKQISNARKKEYELKKEIEYFTNASEQLRAALDAQK